MSLFDQFPNDNSRAGFPYFYNVYWLGPTQVPPLTMPIGMTDRDASATIWYPAVGSAGGHIRFSTTRPPGPVRVYAPYDGPYVGASGFRIGIRSGHVIVDVPPTGGPDSGAGPFFSATGNKLLVAVLFATTFPRVIAGGGFFADHLGFQSDMIQGGIFDPTP